MKHTILTLSILICCLCSMAQPIDSFYRQGTTWINMYHWEYTVPPPPYKVTHYVEGFKLQIDGDTVVNGISYKKLYNTPLGIFKTTPTAPYRVDGPVTPYSDPPAYIGRIRIDGRKVYFTDEGTSLRFQGAEHIMYDFSGKIGDTVERQIYPQKVTITKIDSIQLNTGDYVKRYYYDGDTTFTIIEGIGTRLATPADMRTIVGYKPGVSSYVSVCYTSGNISYKFPVSTQVYDWYHTFTCFDINTVGIATPVTAHVFTIAPNPSQGSFTITGSTSGKEVKIAVVNALGQTVYAATEQVTGNTVAKRITLPGAPAGMYCAVLSSDGIKEVIRVVVE